MVLKQSGGSVRRPLQTSFVGGDGGPWTVDRIDPVSGPSLPYAPHLTVIEGARARPLRNPAWVLRGVARHERYTTPEEHEALVRRQEPLGRADATRAALIPIRKSEEWWQLSQDERRAIFEARSHHIAIGIEYLPVVARRLQHGRDLGEPFDFLTWFEFAPQHSSAFEQLVARLRATEEWSYVIREIDIRLSMER